MSEVNKTIKTEPFDDYPQVKQEFDDCENTSDFYMDDDICRQQFLKSKVTIDEELKQETIYEQDDLTSTNKTVSDKNSYMCDEKIRESSSFVESTNKSFEEVSGKSETTNKLKPYKCKSCSKIFTKKNILKQHEMIHTGERHHECKICNKRFLRLSNLSSHLSVHTEECPYICEICNRKFKTKENLNKHTVIHTGEQPYECKICTKDFYGQVV
ncbi:zinc finger protein 829-like [Ctenocephalides felis]|uniref:zinc finger protein 829-like n=1 Tax=Ctenocephalides felis TaxID=7515 RepID=UPI000E6E151B|nr:zinc finger protein 829-like [Ctenocephalides felis]